MHRINVSRGVTVSYDKLGNGPPLVLVHGAFSDHRTNWEFVQPYFSKRFTVCAVARRGRGETDATEGHTLEDEALDVAAVIRAVGEPVFLLGHSYGAQAALLAASILPNMVRKLVLYEPPRPELARDEVLAALTTRAEAGDWDGLSFWFFRNVLLVPAEELNVLRSTELWAPIVADAKASLGDLRALSKYDFKSDRFAGLEIPTMLQVGTESPPELYVTRELSEALPDIRIGRLEGQAHEGMTTAPGLYADSVFNFLDDAALQSHA